MKGDKSQQMEILEHLLEEATWVHEVSECEGAAEIQGWAESARVLVCPQAQTAYQICSVC